MITKERIDELIQQRAKIWGIGKQGNVFCIGLKFRPHTLNNKKWLENKYEVYRKFFETKEEAEWKAKTSRKRIENFEPLYYNDINQSYCYDYYFSAKNHHEYLIRVSGKDIILFWLNCDYKEYYKNTKEEYEKLVLKCVKLFLGESE